MRRAVGYLFVVVLLAYMSVVGGGARGLAAMPLPQPLPRVAALSPANGAVVGVAQPVRVTFAAPVTDRRTAERSIHVTSPSNLPGHFQWVGDNVVQWVPDHYWPAHSHVSADVQGVQTLSVGVHHLNTGFETGPELLGVASLSEHTFTVSRDGEVLRTMPASMGKPSRPTPVGSYSALEKQRTVVMDSRTIGIPLSSPEGYKITASYAVRVTWNGVYVHSAPWSLDSQGHANVSHGCINLSPSNAAWYFNNVNVGDPIEVVA